MRVLRLNIEQQMAQIDVDIQNARLHLKTPERRLLIENKRPEMKAEYEKPSIELDMEEFKANLGLKSYSQLTAEAAQRAMADARRGIREIVNQSEYLSDVTKNGNKVGHLAKREMLEYKEPEMGHSLVPATVKMDGRPGKLEIEWTGYELSIDLVGDIMPEFYVEPPCSVNVEISTPPRVEISVTEVYIPPSSGRNVNKEA
ncbi:MAG: DUF6470 family protein [Oscillospiraceae bacterium]|jgi:predicted DNA-binding protein (UPF0251 family)